MGPGNRWVLDPFQDILFKVLLGLYVFDKKLWPVRPSSLDLIRDELFIFTPNLLREHRLAIFRQLVWVNKNICILKGVSIWDFILLFSTFNPISNWLIVFGLTIIEVKVITNLSGGSNFGKVSHIHQLSCQLISDVTMLEESRSYILLSFYPKFSFRRVLF